MPSPAHHMVPTPSITKVSALDLIGNIQGEYAEQYGLGELRELRTVKPFTVEDMKEFLAADGRPLLESFADANRVSRSIVKGYRVTMSLGGFTQRKEAIVVIDRDDMTVVDGHHRMTAAILEGVPLRYIDMAEDP